MTGQHDGPGTVASAPAGRVLLVGLGADIGANLLALSSSEGVRHPITDVLTHAVESEGVGAASRSPLDELAHRVLMAAPALYGRVVTDHAASTLTIDGRPHRIHFGDMDADLSVIEGLGRFDLAILATSRRHIRSAEHLARLQAIATTVVGVAENSRLPALYPALLSADPKHFRLGRRESAASVRGSFALGSCQCAGWTAGLRVLAEAYEGLGIYLSDVLQHVEVDIVHPDTASSSFGVKRVGARTEDPRDNLRPGVSQVADSMARFAPATCANNVSLRTLVQPPGYQIQRFFVAQTSVTAEDLIASAHRLAEREPENLRVTMTPAGSRIYSQLPTSTVLLATEQHLTVRRIGDLSQIVLQAFVHNTTGYCASVLAATDHVLSGTPTTIIQPA